MLSDGGDPQGGFLILLTDGLENSGAPISDIQDDILEAGVIIDTIAFVGADETLETIGPDDRG